MRKNHNYLVSSEKRRIIYNSLMNSLISNKRIPFKFICTTSSPERESTKNEAAKANAWKEKPKKRIHR